MEADGVERMTDRELLVGYADLRDLRCLDVFVRRYQDGLLRFASRLLTDDGAAQDVVQETFLRVAEQPKRLIGVDSVHNWLIRVARNICVDHIRRAMRKRRAVEGLAEQRAREEAPPPEAALEREETRQLVQKAIAALRPRHRELLLLKLEEGKSYKEIAEITGLTVTNVGYLLHHAMKAVAEKLSGALGSLEAP
jgi:RNA polymerase sigma-70 factor (ECF subfamily)